MSLKLIPTNWLKSTLVMIPKKKQTTKCIDYQINNKPDESCVEPIPPMMKTVQVKH